MHPEPAILEHEQLSDGWRRLIGLDDCVTGRRRQRVTSGGYGYAVSASIALTYVPTAYAEPGTAVDVDIFGVWVPAEVRAEPLYDPTGERVRA